MLLSHERRFIYLKVAKAASTSVQDYFLEWCKPPQPIAQQSNLFSHRGIVATSPRPLEGTPFHDHIPARELVAILTPETWESYHRFATVREPFESVASAYWQQKAYLGDRGKDLDFETWWNRGPSQRRTDWTKRVLEIDGEPAAQTIVRYEHLENDLAHLCRRLDIEWQPEHLGNAQSHYRPRTETGKMPWNEVIPESLYDEIRQAWAWTFDRFYPDC